MKNLIKKRISNLLKNGDIRYLFKYSRYKLSFEITFFIVGFLITWCFGNFTSPEFYGTYLFITSTIIFFSFLSFAGINQSLIQSVASGYDYFFTTSIRKIFQYSFLGTLTIFAYTTIYSTFVEFDFVVLISLFIGSIFFPISSALSVYHFFLDGKGEFKRDLIYRLINYLVVVLLLLGLIFLTKNLILHFLLLNIIHLITNFYFTRSCLKKIRRSQKNFILDRNALKFGLYLTKYGIITLICLNINNLIIGFYYGPIILAFYTIGKGLSSKINTLIKPTFSVLLTRYSQKGSKVSKAFFLYLVIGSISLFFMIILILPMYLKVLFPDYIESINYGIAYSFITLIMPIVVVFGYYFRGKVEIKIIRNAQIIPDILSLILLIPLLLLFGIYGLILGEFLRYFLRLIIYFIYRKKIEFV